MTSTQTSYVASCGKTAPGAIDPMLKAIRRRWTPRGSQSGGAVVGSCEISDEPMAIIPARNNLHARGTPTFQPRANISSSHQAPMRAFRTNPGFVHRKDRDKP